MTQSVGDLVVSLDVDAAKFTEQVSFVRKQFTGLGEDSSKAAIQGQQSFSKQEIAAQRAGISVGQYKAAMRTLPAQFTDIATQLAGGQSPWLILLEQGGQIKDSFGGMRSTFTALVGAISPVMVGVAGLAVGIGVLAYAFVKGQGFIGEFNKSLVMTGDKSGQTANNLLLIAEAMEKNGGSLTAGVTSLNALATAGANLGTNYQSVATSIAKLSEATGTEVDKLATIFGKITSDPESGLKAMADQYGRVTAQQLDYVKSLQDAGKYTDALNYANGVAAAGFKDMADNIKGNMGGLESAADVVGKAFKAMWNSLLDIGREESLQSQLADATEKLYDADKSLRASGAQGQQRLGIERARDQASQLVTSLTEQLHAEQRNTEEKQKQATLEHSSLLNQQHFQSISDAALTQEQQRTQEYQRLNQYIAERKRLNQSLSNDEIAQIKKGIEEKYKDPKTPKGKAVTTSAGDRAEDSAQRDLQALQSQLKVLQQHTSVNDIISQQRKDLWQTESQYTVLEEAAGTRQLSAQEKSLLAHKNETLEYKRQLADLGDKVVAQQRLNALADQADKFAQQQSAKRASIDAQANGVSSRQAERAATLQRLQETYAFNPTAQQRVLQEQQKTYAAEDALRSNWVAGAKQGWAEYKESATDVFTSVQQVAQAGFNGLAGSLTSLVTTGKASFSDFTTSILKMIVEVIDRLLVAYAVQSALGWISGSAANSSSTPAFSSGAYSNLKMAYNGGYIPEYDAGGYTGHGGKYEPKGIVHGGEFVFTKEATSRLGVANLYKLMRGYASGGLVGNSAVGSAISKSAGISVYAPVTIEQVGNANNSSATDTANTAKQLQGIVQQVVSDRLRKEISPGGLLYKN
ncbi:MAG: phage tail tape measure protein [Rouxiella aceris]|uniref:phage tail tape measure protein n=1 Tax=Rouxiella aceris TaxID=2703884 RepID=UPI00283F0856|nr:phage tail tape measure protein [Rouxiella aceris]MDR3431042.1 phage tail tape measure protein [Rouxiella aceris]